MGYQVKADRIGAPALSRFARTLHHSAQRDNLLLTMPHAEQQQLDALISRRGQLVHMWTAESSRLEQASHAASAKSIQALIDILDKQIDMFDRDIGDKLKMHFAHKLRLLEGLKVDSQNAKGAADGRAAEAEAIEPARGRRADARPAQRAGA
jgi:transposase